MNKLSQSTIEELKYYVYLLIDPRDNKPFYVGKGQGDRVNNHEEWALEHELEQTKKLDKIREIQSSGNSVGQTIVRHGMTSDEAFEVECALIDYIGMDKLTNIMSGHYSAARGLMSLKDIEIKYQAEDAVFYDPVLLININRQYHPDITDAELYEITRKHWAVDLNRVKELHTVCAVFLGIVREVYEVKKWQLSPAPHDVPRPRSYFIGSVASPELRQKYNNKSVAKYWKQGSQNPIKYVEL